MANTEKKQKKVFVLSGVPGSGKSTLVAKLIDKMGGECISRDAIRFSLLKEGEDYFAHENEVVNKFNAAIHNSVKKNENTFIDATHLTPKTRRLVMSQVPSTFDVKFIALSFEVPLEVALERNALRSGRALVPETAILNMYARYQIPSIKTELFDEVWHINEKGIYKMEVADEE